VTFWLTVAEYFVGHCSELERHLTHTASRNVTVFTLQRRRTILKSVLMSLLDRANYCPLGNFLLKIFQNIKNIQYSILINLRVFRSRRKICMLFVTVCNECTTWGGGRISSSLPPPHRAYSSKLVKVSIFLNYTFTLKGVKIYFNFCPKNIKNILIKLISCEKIHCTKHPYKIFVLK
jgi:hypothetical protein